LVVSPRPFVLSPSHIESAPAQQTPATELSITTQVDAFRINNAESHTTVTSMIPAGELAQAKKTGVDKAVFDLVVLIHDSFGTLINNVTDQVEVNLAEYTDADLAKKQFIYRSEHTLLPGAYSVEVQIRDGATGRSGKSVTEFRVANLNREVQNVPITSVILSNQALDAVVKNGKLNLSGSSMMLMGQLPIPGVSHVFSSSTSMYVYLQAYERGAMVVSPMSASVAFYEGRNRVMETSPVTVSEGFDATSKMLPINLTVSLADLKPGDYDLALTVVEPATQKSAVWRDRVTIVP
jgi:hypothetical protein